MAAIHAWTRQALSVNNHRRKCFADASRREDELAVGDQVLLSTENFRLRISQGGLVSLCRNILVPLG